MPTTVYFEYGLTTDYGTTLSAYPGSITGIIPINESVGLYGLTPATIYHYRVKSINELGTTLSEDMTFTSLGPVTDVEGNSYNNKTLGSQVWMMENLKTSKYRNGDPIGTTPTPLTDITGESAPKYQWAYDGDESNVPGYGRLYTWFVVTDSRNVCPTGWHVPSDSEWTTLFDYLIKISAGYGGSGSDIAKSLALPYLWIIDSTPGSIGNDPASNNLSGFCAVPSGARITNTGGPEFSMLGTSCAWWTTSELGSSLASQVILQVYNPEVLRSYFGTEKTGASVRCLKD
jgi:uncharacterized protein (TIGR02145 family)